MQARRDIIIFACRCCRRCVPAVCIRALSHLLQTVVQITPDCLCTGLLLCLSPDGKHLAVTGPSSTRLHLLLAADRFQTVVATIDLSSEQSDDGNTDPASSQAEDAVVCCSWSPSSEHLLVTCRSERIFILRRWVWQQLSRQGCMLALLWLSGSTLRHKTLPGCMSNPSTYAHEYAHMSVQHWQSCTN